MIECDKCYKQFIMKPKVKKWSKGIEEMYFICPHCKERYTSYFTNQDIRRKQKLISKMYGPSINMIEFNKLQKEIKEDMYNLKKSRGL